MKRAEYLAFGVATLMAVDFAEWLYRQRQNPQALSATALLNNSGMATGAALQQELLGTGGGMTAAWGNLGSLQLSESPSDVSQGVTESMGQYGPGI